MASEHERREYGLKEHAHVIRHDWTTQEITALFEMPFNDLLARAHGIHRLFFDPNTIEAASLLSIKTGGCPEDCAYCPQSVHYDTGVGRGELLDGEQVLAQARRAAEAGAQRFCMGAAWRRPRDRDIEAVAAFLPPIKALGLETCLTLGMLTPSQAQRLAEAGLDYYNHNLDTSPEFYEEIITTRTYEDRLQTLAAVREAGIRICCGGIIGMGEGYNDRVSLLQQLAALDPHPESVPINQLVQVPGTPLFGTDKVDPLSFVRMIAVARILMPRSVVRIAAGRAQMDESTQALCFFAGANSVFLGERLLTTPNPEQDTDHQLLMRLGLRLAPQLAPEQGREAAA